MKNSDLIYIGIKGSVIALDRNTGKQVWSTHLKGAGFVNVVVHDNAVLAASYGELFCLDPLTGDGRWHNPLSGLGWGLATIAAEGLSSDVFAAVWAEKQRQDQAASSAATASTVATT